MKKILVFAGIYPDKGTGNVFRMLELSRFIIRETSFQIDFLSNEPLLVKQKFVIAEDMTIKHITDINEDYAIGLYDSAVYDENILKIMHEKSNSNIIAFDYFNYSCPYVSVIINLCNHFPENLSKFEGTIYEGVFYGIIRDQLLNYARDLKGISEPPVVLITFGGEDPNHNTKKAIETCLSQCVQTRTIVGLLNRDREELYDTYVSNVTILEHIEHIEHEYSACDIVICGGGTTLLESLYFKKPVVAVPQNYYEENFIRSIKKNIPIYQLSELNVLLNLMSQNDYMRFLTKQCDIYVDGWGKRRITDIIMERI